MVSRSSRIACVHLPALPLECAFRKVSLDACTKEGRRDRKPPQERLQGTVCAVRSDLRGRKVLVDVSDAARAKRVLAGMTQTEAKARHPKLVLEDRDPAKELEQLSVAAELLLAFGPLVEICPPGFLFVEIGRSKVALRESSEQAIAQSITRTLAKAGHRSRVVITKDPDTGRSLLEHLHRTEAKRTTIVVPPKEEKRLLGRLPIGTALLWTDIRRDPDGKKKEALRAAKASLALLGVEEVHRLQKLPASQITSRFGEAGATLMQRAHAELDRPLEAFVPPDRCLVEELELDRMTDDLEPILFLLKRMFDRLEARLEARARSATVLDLIFLVEPGLANQIDDDEVRPRSSKRRETIQLRFARATRRAGTMLKIAREKLNGALPGSVQAITVEARSPEIDHGAQLDLFTNYARRVEEVGELVGRLTAALGEEAVFSPEILDTHRPEAAWGARPFEIERALEAPEAKRPERRLHTETKETVVPEAASGERLPQVSKSLTVTGRQTAGLGAPARGRPKPKRSWPKPIPRKPEDEPVPQLPPRPLELLETPEPASLASEPGTEGGVLRWRGQRLRLAGLHGAERLEGEWWTKAPLARDYVIAEGVDGRRYWLFYAPGGALYVHGVFD